MRSRHVRNMVLMAPLFLAACSSWGPEAAVVKSQGVITAQKSATEYIEVGRAHFSAKRYGLALEAFKGGLALEANSVSALNWIGASYDMLGRFDLARSYFLRALHIEPGSAQTLNNIGYSFLLQRDADRARVYLSEAAKSLARNDAAAEQVIAANLAAVGKHTAGSKTPPDPRGKPAGHLSREPRDTGALLIRLAEHVYEIRTLSSGDGFARSAALRQQRSSSAGAPKSAKSETAFGTGSPGGEGSPKAQKPDAVGRHSRKAGLAVMSADQSPLERNSCLRPPVVEVSNGAGRRGLAARLTQHLELNGVRVGRVTNAAAFTHRESVIFYSEGCRDEAEKIAQFIPVSIELQAVGEQNAYVRVRLGGDVLEFDRNLIETSKQVL